MYKDRITLNSWKIIDLFCFQNKPYDVLIAVPRPIVSKTGERIKKPAVEVYAYSQNLAKPRLIFTILCDISLNDYHNTWKGHCAKKPLNFYVTESKIVYVVSNDSNRAGIYEIKIEWM